MNYLTAQFALAERGGLREGETVLVHGAAGGVGTATIQVAKGYGARTIAVVSTEEKAEIARQAGADETVLARRASRTRSRSSPAAGASTWSLDVVGGDVFTDSLRVLATAGPAAGGRLRRRPGHPRGQGQPAAAQQRRRPRRRLGRLRDDPPGYMQEQWARAPADDRRAASIKPPIGATYALEDFGRALADMDERRTLGKSVVRLRD